VDAQHGLREKHASATAVSSMARLLNLGPISSEEVFHLAKGGNPRALQIFDSVGLHSARCSRFDQHLQFLLYLLGRTTAAWELFESSRWAEATRRSFIYRNNPPRVERTGLGADAGLYGAAYLALRD
jgi:predicted NBD/HSP70 family sugar kinase